MNSTNSTLSSRRADLLVTSQEAGSVLLVEVKRRKIDETARQQIDEASKIALPEFVMAVDPRHILVARTEGGTPRWNDGLRLSTPQILGAYTEATDFERVEDFYLESLVEAWLRDLAQGWKFARPPGFDELNRVGLVSRLRGGEIHVEARL